MVNYFCKKKLKRRGRERVKLMIKSHGKVTYCHGKVMEIDYYISVGTLHTTKHVLIVYVFIVMYFRLHIVQIDVTNEDDIANAVEYVQLHNNNEGTCISPMCGVQCCMQIY